MDKTTMKRKREALGMTREELAKVLHIYPKRYARFEEGNLKGIYFCEAYMICLVLGLDIDELLSSLEADKVAPNLEKVTRVTK